jgi:hypothetical protein
MPLTMRTTGLASPVDQNREDFTIYSGEWAMGRIYQQRGGPESMRCLVALWRLRQAC